MSVRQPKIDLDLHQFFGDEGEPKVADKSLLVCHETISPDAPGLADIRAVAEFLDREQLEIHGMIDKDGNFGWSKGDRNRVFDHVSSSGSKGFGNVAARSVGIELISKPPSGGMKEKIAYWNRRRKQLAKLAHVAAWLGEDIPLKYSDSSLDKPGITTHWDVTMRWGVSGGHVDCHPRHKGGYFPVKLVIRWAQQIRMFSKLGLPI